MTAVSGPSSENTVVVVTGDSGTIGQRIVARLAAETGITRIVGLDSTDIAVAPSILEHHRVDLQSEDLKALFEGADALVTAWWQTPDPLITDDNRGTGSLDALTRVLEAAGATGIRTIVHLSSATVYGAWPDNPLPLTEDAPIRPNPGFLFAAEHAQAERLVADWQDDHPGSTVAVLRPAVVLGAGERETWESRTVGGGLPLRPREAAPSQFLDPDDLAAAVALAVSNRLDGVFNVAPDGWIAGDAVRPLAGGMLSLALPERWVRRFRRWSWRTKLGAVPPEAVAYTLHPWVVANDRLEAEGWKPAHSNEEVLVAGRRGSWWRELSPKRRQEFALGGAGVAIAGLGAAVAYLVRRGVRRRAAGR